jgi:hypothetical protein
VMAALWSWIAAPILNCCEEPEDPSVKCRGIRSKGLGASDMTSSPNQLVLFKATKSRNGESSHDDYDMRDSLGKVVGSILRHPKDRLWFWTITAREIQQSVQNHGYSATRKQAIADFKTRWSATHELRSHPSP